MRKVILQEFVTVDGFAAGPNDELDFSESTANDAAVNLDSLHFVGTIDTILLGAETYRGFVSFWPTATTDTQPIADALNGTPKIVFSTTLDRAPWGRWQEARLVKTSAAEEVANLKQQPGKDIVVWGSISLAQSLMKDGLIDEYQLLVCPVAIGSGRHLFPDGIGLHSMKLIDSKVYECGVVSLTYRPAAASATR